MSTKILVKSVSESSTPTVRLQVIYTDEDNRIENVVLTFLRELFSVTFKSGDELSEEEYSAMTHAANVTAAIKKGLQLLSFSANSESMLAVKLRRRGIDGNDAREAAAYLGSHGYINEDGDAKREVERCLRKHWGAARIIAHLKSKGFDEQTVSNIEAELENEDFSIHCAKLIAMSYCEIPEEPSEKRKLIASLARHGYTMSEIDAGIKQFKGNAV